MPEERSRTSSSSSATTSSTSERTTNLLALATGAGLGVLYGAGRFAKGVVDRA